MTQIRTKRRVAAIFEFGVWTLVRVFTVYFSNVKGQLLKVELDINSEQRKCEYCRGRPLRAVDAAHEASSCSEIDSGLGTVCKTTEHAENGLFYFAVLQFPANKTVRRVWLQRSELTRKDFVFTDNSQMCSQHFIDFHRPTKQHPFPSIFPNKIFKTSAVDQVNIDVETSLTDHTVPDEQVEMESHDYECKTLVSSSSALNTSVILHDYCGKVDQTTVSHIVNQSVQISLPHLSHTYTDAAVQCGNPFLPCDLSTQTNIKQTANIGVQTTRPCFIYENVRHNDQKVMFFTGIPDAATFKPMF